MTIRECLINELTLANSAWGIAVNAHASAMETIGQTLKEERQWKRLSIRKVARRIGEDHSNLAKREKGALPWTKELINSYWKALKQAN